MRYEHKYSKSLPKSKRDRQEINKTSRVPLATKKESLVDQVEDIMASSKPAAATKKRPRAEPAAGEENSKGNTFWGRGGVIHIKISCHTSFKRFHFMV